MATTTRSGSWPRRAALLMLAALLAPAGLLTGCGSSDRIRLAGAFSAADRATLTGKAVAVLERNAYPLDMPAEVGASLVCAADVLAAGPASATVVADVRTIYVWADCGEPTPRHVEGSTVSVPVVIDLTGNGSVKAPRDGADYGSDLRRLFPKQLQSLVETQPANIDVLDAQVQAVTGPRSA